jgi:hypothetical protein
MFLLFIISRTVTPTECVFGREIFSVPILESSSCCFRLTWGQHGESNERSSLCFQCNCVRNERCPLCSNGRHFCSVFQYCFARYIPVWNPIWYVSPSLPISVLTNMITKRSLISIYCIFPVSRFTLLESSTVEWSWSNSWSQKVWSAILRCAINPLNAELSPICHLLAFLGAHHILHVSSIRVNYGYLFYGVFLAAFTHCWDYLLSSEKWLWMLSI